MKKVLIIYATAGIGHAKAAFAIKKAFDEMGLEGVETTLIDSLDYMTGFFRKTYLASYLHAIQHASKAWGFSYCATNNRYIYPFISIVRRYFNWLHSRRFVKFLLGYRPDVVISTHFLANEVISRLKGKGLLATKLITVITDYRFHTFWGARHVDFYVTGSREAQDDLGRIGVRGERVKVLGIPVEPVFTKHLDRSAISNACGLEKGRLTVLIVGGGFGIGPIEEIVKSLDAMGHNVQAIVICGYNEPLRKKIELLKGHIAMPLVVYGFVNTMHELMEVSDCLVSKSGGLTATEALVKGLPMVIISPIPGQESRNSDVLVSRGAAIRIEGPSEIEGAIRRFVLNPRELDKMKASIRTIARPRAAFDIAKLALEP